MELLSSFLFFAATVMMVLAVGGALSPALVSRRLARLEASPLDAPDRRAERRGPGLMDEEKSWMVRALAPLARPMVTSGPPINNRASTANSYTLGSRHSSNRVRLAITKIDSAVMAGPRERMGRWFNRVSRAWARSRERDRASRPIGVMT